MDFEGEVSERIVLYVCGNVWFGGNVRFGRSTLDGLGNGAGMQIGIGIGAAACTRTVCSCIYLLHPVSGRGWFA